MVRDFLFTYIYLISTVLNSLGFNNYPKVFHFQPTELRDHDPSEVWKSPLLTPLKKPWFMQVSAVGKYGKSWCRPLKSFISFKLA